MIGKQRCPTCGQIPLKTNAQRNQFHRMCRELAKHAGETPGHIKTAIKVDYYGIDEFKIGNKWYRGLRSSEASDKEEYSGLIEQCYIFAAEHYGYEFDRTA